MIVCCLLNVFVCVVCDVLCVVVVCATVWLYYVYACLLKYVYVLCDLACDVVWSGCC